MVSSELGGTSALSHSMASLATMRLQWRCGSWTAGASSRTRWRGLWMRLWPRTAWAQWGLCHQCCRNAPSTCQHPVPCRQSRYRQQASSKAGQPGNHPCCSVLKQLSSVNALKRSKLQRKQQQEKNQFTKPSRVSLKNHAFTLATLKLNNLGHFELVSDHWGHAQNDW